MLIRHQTGKGSRMVKTFSASVGRAFGDKILILGLARVKAPDAEPRALVGCLEVASVSGTGLTANWHGSARDGAEFCEHFQGRRAPSDSSSPTGSYHRSIHTSPWLIVRPLYSSSRSFATAAINILEPGKHWRGRGWNRVGMGDTLLGRDAGSLASLNFGKNPDLEEKLKFLESCGLGETQLQQMRKRLPTAVKNTFLKLSVKKLIEVATFLEDEFGVKKMEIGNLLFVNPFIAGSSVEDCLQPKMNFFRSRGIDKEETRRMVLRCPQILTVSLEGKLLPVEQRLLGLGLTTEEVVKLFVKYPAVFGTSLGKLDRNIQALRSSGVDISKAIFKIPQIFSLSLDKKFVQIMDYLQDELKLQREDIVKVLSSRVTIVSFSVEANLRPKVGYFVDLGLHQDDIGRLYVKYPNLFCHSLDNSIKPKMQYLMQKMKLHADELVSFPHYLSYSLLGRIIPRHEYVLEHGLSYTLASLLSCGDDVFEKRYAVPGYVYNSLARHTPGASIEELSSHVRSDPQ